MEKTIMIEGMTCSGCSGRVEKLLNKIDGVQAKVSHEENKADVKISGDVSDDVLKSTVESAGFKVVGIR